MSACTVRSASLLVALFETRFDPSFPGDREERQEALRAKAKELVQKAMAALRSDRTSFVIAHRLSTVRDADPAGTWELFCEGVNEAWNSGFPAYAYFGNTYYSANSLTVYDSAGTPGRARTANAPRAR